MGFAMLSRSWAAFTRTDGSSQQFPVAAAEASPPVRDPLHRVAPRFYTEAIALPTEDVSAGYQAGIDGHGCPASASRAYWHGWRNGRFTSGREELDEPARCLLEQAARVSPYQDRRWMNYDFGDRPLN